MPSWPAALHPPTHRCCPQPCHPPPCTPPSPLLPSSSCCLPASQAKGKTSEAITKLCQLAPPTALLLTLDPAGGQVVGEREVPTELVHRGDALKVGHSAAWLPACLPGAPSPPSRGCCCCRCCCRCWPAAAGCCFRASVLMPSLPPGVNPPHPHCRCCRGLASPLMARFWRAPLMWMRACSPESQVGGRASARVGGCVGGLACCRHIYRRGCWRDSGLSAGMLPGGQPLASACLPGAASAPDIPLPAALPCPALLRAEAVQKQAGAPVYGGTVNVGGPLRIRASRSAASCQLQPSQAA